MRKYPQRVILSFIIVLVLILWGLYGFMQHIDPTNRLLFYPNIEDKDNNTTYIFPAFDQEDIFLEKKSLNFKTLYPMIGTKLDEFLREKYDFNYIKRTKNGEGAKYLIYTNMDTPYAYITTDRSDIITSIGGVYLSNANLNDKYLRGMYIEEITRLKNHLSEISDKKPVISKSDDDKRIQYLTYKTNETVRYANSKKSLIYSIQVGTDSYVRDLSDLSKSSIKTPIDISISIEIEK